MPRARCQSGFSMLELSIVITIIAVVTGMGMMAGINAVASARRAQTESKLDLIEKSLAFYQQANHRLPCPADATKAAGDASYGVEAAVFGDCLSGTPAANYGVAGGVVEGTVPTRALNLPSEFMYDGWGRKLVYAVDTNATEFEAFSDIGLNESCGITVNDSSGNARTTGAIYLVMSYGEDGHGAYLPAGIRMSTGTANADELTNCHCDGSAGATAYAPSYVQKETTENPATPSDRFDDHVRFKERWQMLTAQDQDRFTYIGPKLLAAYDNGGGAGSATTYSTQCGKFIRQPDLNPVPSYSNGAVFTGSNDYIVTVSNAQCYLFPITNGTPALGNTASIPNCPIYDPNMRIAMSKSGYLAVATGASNPAPYVRIWKQNGATFTQLPDITTTPPGLTTQISISDDYMLLSDNNTIVVYGRQEDKFIPLGTQPTGIPASIYSSTISPDQHYIAVTVQGNPGNSPPVKVYIWRINADSTFTALPVVDVLNQKDPAGIKFSPDGRYFVLGGQTSENLVIYQISVGDTFTRLPLPTGWTSAGGHPGQVFAFSPDSVYLTMMTPDAANSLVIFRQTTSKQYKYMGQPDVTDANPGTTMFFHY